jgi:heme/copper-type cytochrome/quinol oxidase subunit 4
VVPHSHLPGGTSEETINLNQNSRFPSDIRAEHLPNITSELYHYTPLRSVVSIIVSIIITVAEIYLPSQTMNLPVTAITQNSYSIAQIVLYILYVFMYLDWANTVLENSTIDTAEHKLYI